MGVASIQSFETAFRMQTEAEEAFDVSRETRATQRLYGMDAPETADYGQKCLLARRLVERGVRFVVVNHGNWDQHGGLKAGHARKIDLEGLVQQTLVDAWQSGSKL
jgi:hypothetical protein